MSIDDVSTAVGATPWPVLPEYSLVLVEGRQVSVRHLGRGPGLGVRQDGPEGDLLRRLDQARVKLGASNDMLAGIAFSHR